MEDTSTNPKCSRVSLRKEKDYGVMAKILDIKLDEKIGVHMLMLNDGIISGMSLFLCEFQFLHLKNEDTITGSQGCYKE